MKFEYPLESGKLIKRYKRFLADVSSNGDEFTVHCPNTGSMKGCATPGSKVWFWNSKNPKRKYLHTWEMLENEQGHLIGINTHRANALVREAIENNIFPSIPFDQTNDLLKSEVAYGKEKSRIDLLLTQKNLLEESELQVSKKSRIWIEVKNTTLLDSINEEDTEGYFPDAVTSRGTKHLRELIQQVNNGDRAVLIFCVQHTGIKSVRAASHIDPLYAQTLQQAVEAGVEVIATKTYLSEEEIKIVGEIPFLLDSFSNGDQ